MKPNISKPVLLALGLGLGIPALAPAADRLVDFRYTPPEWQAAICLPDDPHKSLVDKSGALLYHYRRGGREFGTVVSVKVTDNATWQKQKLHSARVPIVKTWHSVEGLEIVEEALAITRLPQAETKPEMLTRVDNGQVNRDWAKPEGDVDPALRDIAVHYNGAIEYEIAVKAASACLVALALCESWWDQAGKRVQVLEAEGVPPKMLDTVADIGKNKAAAFWFEARDVDSNGRITIRVAPAKEAADQNTILNGLWVFERGQAQDSPALLAGKLNSRALARLNLENPGGPPRNDLIIVHVKNTRPQARTLEPRLVVDTVQSFQFQPERQQVVLDNHETVTASLKMADALTEAKTRREIPLGEVKVPAGETARFHVLFSSGGPIVIEPKTLEQALAYRDQAVAYWEKEAPLPYDRIQVPDAGVQALIDSATRNIWQAREIKRGLPAFQVGPTCYRGLWIVDGAFLLEAATLLGAGKEARAGIEYMLSFQQTDGRFEIIKNYHKENGIVLWACVRHAQLTQDKAWLESVWPRLERTADYIRVLRRQTRDNESPLDDGLMPPGFPDGGLAGKPYEYSNVYWNLLGLRAFIGAAQWLGRNETAAAWQKEHDDFMAAFRQAAERDLRKDPHGNPYLPTVMGESTELPQRAQWGFCHAVYPGQVFEREDPLVAGNMKMLEATEQEGMVYGTGWDATGIWNYFASFYGHAWLWQGDGRKAADVLYAFANHAAPILAWREEQSVKGEKYKKVGDMPHNWASAEFIRLAAHLLALDRGRELHLFEGLPLEWTRAGMVTKLTGISTPFGPLTLSLTVSKDRQTARLQVNPLRDLSCERIIVHLGGWASPQKDAAIELDLRRAHDREIRIEALE